MAIPDFSTQYTPLPNVNFEANAMKGRLTSEYVTSNNKEKLSMDVKLFDKKAEVKYTNTTYGNATIYANTKGNIGANASIPTDNSGNVYAYLNANMSNSTVTGGIGYENKQGFNAKAFYNSNASMQKLNEDISTSSMKFGVSITKTF